MSAAQHDLLKYFVHMAEATDYKQENGRMRLQAYYASAARVATELGLFELAAFYSMEAANTSFVNSTRCGHLINAISNMSSAEQFDDMYDKCVKMVRGCKMSPTQTAKYEEACKNRAAPQ